MLACGRQMERYQVEKLIWTEADFATMGWHDATIHAIALGPSDFTLVLDIDYIFAWRQPAAGVGYFSFWVSPCTLVFHNVSDLDIDLKPFGRVTVSDLHRGEECIPRNAHAIGRHVEWRWNIECDSGSISMRALGFRQYVRAAPVLSTHQVLEFEARGGISFALGAGRKADGA